MGNVIVKKFDLQPKASESALNDYIAKNSIQKADIIKLDMQKRSDGILSIIIAWQKDPPKDEQAENNKQETDDDD